MKILPFRVTSGLQLAVSMKVSRDQFISAVLVLFSLGLQVVNADKQVNIILASPTTTAPEDNDGIHHLHRHRSNEDNSNVFTLDTSVKTSFPWQFEAEDATDYSSSFKFVTFLVGYTGSGILSKNGRCGIPGTCLVQWDNLHPINMSEEGLYEVSFRYTNGRDFKLPLRHEVFINGLSQGLVPFPQTGKWVGTYGYTKPVTIFLPEGVNTIRLSNYDAYFTNILDHLLIEPTTTSKYDLLDTIAALKSHVDGTSFLTKPEILSELDKLLHNVIHLKDCNCLNTALDLVETYEDLHGALFINSETEGGFERDWDTDDELYLERAMISIQQTIIDSVYRLILPYNSLAGGLLGNCATELHGRYWKTANFFPGYVALTNDPTMEYSIDIDATEPIEWGLEKCYGQDAAVKPTGMYLSPGGIATIEVTAEMINKGYQIQVGASSADHILKTKHLRMDRVTSTYYVYSNITYVASPLGGNIYIKVPYLADDGVVTVKVTGDVVQAPIFSMTSVRKTSPTEWNDVLRHSPAPWTDFETDVFLMQVPTIWINQLDYDYFADLLTRRSDALIDYAKVVGIPIDKRNKHVLYLQPDLYKKHSTYGTGYPQINSFLKVGPDGPLHMDSYLVINPYLNWIEFHELSHCNLRSNRYRGEREAVVNFPFTYVRNVHMNEDLDVAFSLSIPNSNGAFATDNAAIDWMVTTQFRDGEEMNYSNTYLDQFKYQNRGSAKYANFVKLFGWQAFMNFNFAYNNDVENGLIASEFDTDSRTLRLSKAAGVDLTPLIHFWGIHPMDEEKLKSEMTANGLDLSCRVYDLISRYLTLIPRANSDFLAFFKTVYPGKYEPGTCKTIYGCGWYVIFRNAYNEEHSAKAIAAGEELLDNYYGNNICSGAPSADPSASLAPTTATALSEAPSTARSADPTGSARPTQDPCPGLDKDRCNKQDLCAWNPVKKLKVCVPKQEHDCTQHVTKKDCKQAAAGVCIFDSANRWCRHRCTGKIKKSKCNKIKNKSGRLNICTFKKQKNPCFKCHAWSVCGFDT